MTTRTEILISECKLAFKGNVEGNYISAVLVLYDALRKWNEIGICPVCGEKIDNIFKHMHKHRKFKNEVCINIVDIDRIVRQLSYHVTHNPHIYKCLVCGDKFRYKYDITRHIIIKHISMTNKTLQKLINVLNE